MVKAVILPYDLILDRDLVNLLSEADYLLGQLACGIGNIRFQGIKRGLLVREFVSLGEADGYKDDLNTFLIDSVTDTQASERMQALAAAFEAAAETLKTENVSAPLIITLHNRAAGKSPDDIPADDLRQCLADTADFMMGEPMPVLIRAGVMLAQMRRLEEWLPEAGKSGQLLLNLFLISQEMIPVPGLNLSPFFQATARDYQELCSDVTESDDWSSWLTYFLRGVSRTCEDMISRIARMEAVVREWRTTASDLRHKTMAQVIEQLAGNPYLTVNSVAEHLDVAFTTAQRAVDKLLEQGIIEETTDQKRGRIYCARAILDILEEPARVINVTDWRTDEPADVLESLVSEITAPEASDAESYESEDSLPTFY